MFNFMQPTDKQGQVKKQKQTNPKTTQSISPNEVDRHLESTFPDQNPAIYFFGSLSEDTSRKIPLWVIF